MIDVRIDNTKSFTLAKVSGELRGEGSKQFSDAMRDFASVRNNAVAIDLSGVSSVDSSGLGALIHLVAHANVTGVRIVLVAPSPFVTGILEVTRLDKWFEIFDSLQEAEKSLAN